MFTTSTACCLGFGVLARCQTPLPGSTISEASQSTEKEYNTAVYLLEHGRGYEFAITNLREANAAAPKNSAYHFALACALEDRSASIADAASQIGRYQEYKELYLRALKKWQAVQNRDAPDSSSRDAMVDAYAKQLEAYVAAAPASAIAAKSAEERRQFAQNQVSVMQQLEQNFDRRYTLGSPPPMEPVLRTRDDHKPFLFSLDEAEKQFSGLTAEAQNEFKTAISLSASDEETSEILCGQAWAERMTEKGKQVFDPNTHFDDSKCLSKMQESIRLNPNSVFAWKSLADLAVAGRGTKDDMPESNRDIAIRAYQKAIDLGSRDVAPVSYRLYCLLSEGAKRAPDSLAEQEDLLTRLIHAQPGNSLPRLLLANLLLHGAMNAPWESEARTSAGSEFLQVFNEAATTPSFTAIEYNASVPRYLSFAWGYFERQSFPRRPAAFVKQLAESACSYAKSELAGAAKEEGLQILRIVVAIGSMLERGLPQDPSVWNLWQQEVYIPSINARLSGYTSLYSAYRETNDLESARQVKEAENALMKTFGDRMTNSAAEATYGFDDEANR